MQNPIGERIAVPSDRLEQGEHGAGIGVSGGHSTATAQNTQSGGVSSHPIADKYMGSGDYASSQQTSGSEYSPLGASGGPMTANPAGATGGLALGSAVGSEHHSHHGHHHHHHHQGAEQAVSGAYEGGEANAMTGQSHAISTGAGVGPLGENMRGPTGGLTGQDAYGTGVGPTGGAGGHYSTEKGYGGVAAGAAAGAGAGAAIGGARSGAGPEEDAVAGQGTGSYGAPSATTGKVAGASSSGPAVAAEDVGAGSGGHGHYGNVSEATSGEPISHPDDIDTGGKHSLVYQESTGKYVHRHEL